MSDTDYACNAFHYLTNVTDTCTFVQNTSSCDIDEGFINYTTFLYCSLDSITVVVACILLLLWWIFLFCGLATTADDFFCPTLAVISESLKLSHNVAGVTFLAFGNGAPDIFSAIAAIGSAKAGDAGLAIGALFGASMFVTTVAAGCIAIIHPFTCMQRPFLRDIVFYLATTYWVFVCMWDKVIYQWEAIGFIVLYIIYVVVVLLGRYINQKLKKRNGGEALSSVLEESTEEVESVDERTHLLHVNVTVVYTNNADKDTRQLQECKYDEMGMAYLLFYGLNPIDIDRWHRMKILRKIYTCFKSPLVLLLKLTIPIVNMEDAVDDVPTLRNWNRPLNSLHLFTAPVFIVLATKIGFTSIASVFPVWALVMIVCLVASLIVLFTTHTDQRPVYHSAYIYLGFVSAFVWVYCIANEIVNILRTLGVVFNVSDAILGLTLLAGGNSIADLIADTSVARSGYPRIAISACFGGTMFNLLLGLGIPITVYTVKTGQPYQMSVQMEEIVLAAGLGVSLIFSLIVVPLSGFKMSRSYGISLILLYVIFLTVALLTGLNIIPNSSL